MHTSTKVALGILLGGTLISAIIGVYDYRTHNTSAPTDSDYDTVAVEIDDHHNEPVEAAIHGAIDTVREEVAETPEAPETVRDLRFTGEILSGGKYYAIDFRMTLRRTPDDFSGGYMWRATGKYAYQTTLDNYGSGPSSWFTFTGHGPGDSADEPTELTLQIKHPDGSDFEQWTLTPTSDGFKGTILNLNTFDTFPVELMRR